VENVRGSGVSLNGMALTEHGSPAAFESAGSGWYNAAANLIVAKSDTMPVATAKEFVFQLQGVASQASVSFVCDRGFTQTGESIYVVGGLPELGNWDVARAIKLSPNIYYEYIWNPPAAHNGPGPSAPVWSGVISGLPPNTTFEWKCVRKREDGTGSPQFEPGPNNVFTTGAGGYSGRGFASF
jgi:alpha-glucosidase